MIFFSSKFVTIMDIKKTSVGGANTVGSAQNSPEELKIVPLED